MSTTNGEHIGDSAKQFLANASHQKRLLGEIEERLDFDTTELDDASLVAAERLASELSRRLMAEAWGRRTRRKIPPYDSLEWRSFFEDWMNSPSED